MGPDSEDAMTRPTIETVLLRINTLGESLQSQLNSLHADVGILKSDVSTLKSDVSTLTSDVGTLKSDVAEVKSDVGGLKSEFLLYSKDMDVRIDRIEGMTNQTRAEMLNLRADLREWKEQLNSHLPKPEH